MKNVCCSIFLLIAASTCFLQAQPDMNLQKKAKKTSSATIVNPIRVDGIISSAEWGKQPNVKRFSFDLGECYYKTGQGILYFAFQITTDMYDDQQSDQLILYSDVNNNTVLEGNEAIKCEQASYFGKTDFLNTYSYRSWEFAIPLKLLARLPKSGFAFRVVSKIPNIDKIVNYQKTYPYQLVVDNGIVIISRLDDYKAMAANGVPAGDSSIKIISKKILDNGQCEISYSDGSKKLLYAGGYTIIAPDGRKSSVSFVSVSPFTPPNAPDDPDMAQYLQNLSNTLLSMLGELLNNDQESIANFKKGDANLSIYKIINRRFEFINYINSKK